MASAKSASTKPDDTNMHSTSEVDQRNPWACSITSIATSSRACTSIIRRLREERDQVQADRCPICLTTSLSSPLTRLTLPCTHTFCTNCLTVWLSSSTPHCPICRRERHSALFPLILPGFIFALPFALAPEQGLVLLIASTVAPWILLYVPALGITYLICGELPSLFGILCSSYLTAYLWTCLAAWFYRLGACCGCCAYAAFFHTQETLEFGKRGEKSIWQLANTTPFTLYVCDRSTPISLWMISGTLLMLAALGLRLGLGMVKFRSDS